ncbi:MAG: hypothetical protein VXY74_06615, partial [SAR324 cluster bacterium]|nr:hypothetical protein [SAR324 cluster bacterium]
AGCPSIQGVTTQGIQENSASSGFSKRNARLEALYQDEWQSDCVSLLHLRRRSVRDQAGSRINEKSLAHRHLIPILSLDKLVI